MTRRASRGVHAVREAPRQPAAGREPFVRPAFVVFLVALAVRLLHVWQMRATPYFTMLMGDARGYDTWARELAAGHWIGSEVFYQAPLYPYFLGGVYAIAGADAGVARLAQAVVGSLSCVLLAYAGARWFSRGAGLAAGLALALYAPAIFFDGIIQKSVLDVFFVCAALALSGRLAGADAGGTSGAERAAWLALGVAVGALSLTRENALVLVAVVGAWAFARQGRRASIGQIARGPLALLLAGVVLTLAPVAARNYAVGGGFYLTTSQFGPNFYIGNNPRADGTYMSLRTGRGSPEFERLDATEIAERALGRTLTPGEVSGYWTDRALQFMADEPGRWLRLQGRKAALLVNATEMLDTESQETHAEYSWPVRRLQPLTHFGVLVPLAVIGLWTTWPQRRRLWLLYAIGATYALSTVMFFVFARYRYPLVPVLLLFAVAGLAAVWRDIGEGSTLGRGLRAVAALPARWPAGACAVLVAAIVANWPLLSIDRMRAITETNLGTAFYERGLLAEAVDRYRRALAIQPDYVPAYNNLGVALRAQGQVSEAIGVYEQGLRLLDDYPDLHFNLANALMEQGRAGEAAAHLRAASAGTPDSAAVHNNLGKALAERGQLTEALAEFERALALEPDSATALRNVASILDAQGRTAEALDRLRRAVEVDPANADARYDLGHMWLEEGRFDAAARELEAAVRLAPDRVEARNNLGIALASQGRLADAIAQWEAALRIQPGFADARRNLDMARKAMRDH